MSHQHLTRTEHLNYLGHPRLYSDPNYHLYLVWTSLGHLWPKMVLHRRQRHGICGISDLQPSAKRSCPDRWSSWSPLREGVLNIRSL